MSNILIRKFNAALTLALLSGAALAQPDGKAAVSNPYGIDALWAQGDLVARGTLVLLVLFSLGSWYVLATKLAQSLRLSREGRQARDTVLRAETLAAGAAVLDARSTYRYVTETGLAADLQYQGAVAEHVDRNEWINASLQQAVDDVQARQQEGLALLATVGATAPFVGLFGTVWGIYHALTEIGIAGQASIDKVAGPVGEALIMTAIGLAVAVPAVLGYNWLVRRNKVTLDAVRRFGTELHRALLGAQVLAPLPPAAAAARAEAARPQARRQEVAEALG
ncbi:MotA/TolQ/ExbB proton channel family protein [Pelomonas sp. KK5]|uniref:MotA/TolQ/ExbB proton channel family protein n=1 Tax=Pelomonas sp. KK5 TaxID=1855730 RepID=UPI0009FB228D|nr:MotA/TolQ/ExbB proton channel family protein [Pelomonas sp. KK5]